MPQTAMMRALLRRVSPTAKTPAQACKALTDVVHTFYPNSRMDAVQLIALLAHRAEIAEGALSKACAERDVARSELDVTRRVRARYEDALGQLGDAMLTATREAVVALEHRRTPASRARKATKARKSRR